MDLLPESQDLEIPEPMAEPIPPPLSPDQINSSNADVEIWKYVALRKLFCVLFTKIPDDKKQFYCSAYYVTRIGVKIVFFLFQITTKIILLSRARNQRHID